MTMALSFRNLPPEIEAARQTLIAAYGDSMPTRDSRLKRVLLYVVMLAVGAAIGLGLVLSGVVSPTDKDFWRAGLTTVSVLSGFMVATMVFTGKIEAAKSLTVTEFRQVAAKLTHLLLNQFGTLSNHFICLLAMFFTPSFAARWSMAAESLAILSLALFFVSIVRSMFIPLQIIELHRFTHAALLRDKRDEAARESMTM